MLAQLRNLGIRTTKHGMAFPVHPDSITESSKFETRNGSEKLFSVLLAI